MGILTILYMFTGIGLFTIGLYALIIQAHLLRKTLAINIMGSGVFLVYVTLAYRNPGELPDPVPHAMVLTGIVVSISATALALVLAYRVKKATDRASLSDDESA